MDLGILVLAILSVGLPTSILTGLGAWFGSVKWGKHGEFYGAQLGALVGIPTAVFGILALSLWDVQELITAVSDLGWPALQMALVASFAAATGSAITAKSWGSGYATLGACLAVVPATSVTVLMMILNSDPWFLI